MANYKISLTWMVTPYRGYPSETQGVTRIPHEVIKKIFGEPYYSEEEFDKKDLHPRSFKKSDDCLGYWHLDINGDPMAIELVDPEKRYQQQLRFDSDPSRAEVVRIRGNGKESFNCFMALIYARFGFTRENLWREKSFVKPRRNIEEEVIERLGVE